MNLSSSLGLGGGDSLEALSENSERVLCRGWRGDGERTTVLAVVSASEHPAPDLVDRLAHEYGLKADLDSAWAARPLELARERAHTIRQN